jgi:transcriptional regulator with XRE-family HTH domain
VSELFKILGDEIAQQRQAKGLTLSQLSARTKITEGFLEKMEQGDFSFLPAVYIRAFIRTVSMEIGLDPEIMARRFSDEAARAVSAKASSGETPLPPAVERPHPVSAQLPDTADEAVEQTKPADTEWFKSPFTLGIMLLALLALVYFVFSRKPVEEPGAMDTGIAVVAPAPESMPLRDAPLVPINEDNKVDSTAVTRSTLTLKAEETAWVRIVYQDSLVEEGVFTEGLSRSWMSTIFYLKIGNAGGIRLALDGRDLGMPGQKGQVVTIMVTKDGIAPVDAAQAPAQLTQMRP